MTRTPQSVLKPRSLGALRRALRAEFEAGAPLGPALPTDRYCRAVTAVVRRRYGVPVPATLQPLIRDAHDLRLPPEAVADFMGRRFDLRVLPSVYAKRSS